MRAWRPFAGVLLIAMTSALTNLVFATYQIGNSKCRDETCTQASQRCAYGGTENPPPCEWCYGGNQRGYCGWSAIGSCWADEGQPPNCGTKVTGALCSQNVCSGGVHNPGVPCGVPICDVAKQPPPGEG